MNLKDGIDRFLSDLEISRSPNTVHAYRAGLEHLLSVKGNVPAYEIDPETVPEYVRWLHEHNPISQASLNVYLAALSRFYEWLALSDEVEADSLRFSHWCRQFRRPAKRRAPKLPDEDLVQKVLEKVRSSMPSPERPNAESGRNMMLRWLRDRALIETLRCTGCRIDEVLRLTNGDLKDGRAVVRGKGDRQRTIFWDDVGWQAVGEYLSAKGNAPDEPLFCAHNWVNDGGISGTYARDVLAKWTRAATFPDKMGTEGHLTPHQFRHRFATKVLRSTGNLALAQDLLGHQSPETTRIYTEFNDDELEQGHQSVNL